MKSSRLLMAVAVSFVDRRGFARRGFGVDFGQSDL